MISCTNGPFLVMSQAEKTRNAYSFLVHKDAAQEKAIVAVISGFDFRLSLQSWMVARD